MFHIENCFFTPLTWSLHIFLKHKENVISSLLFIVLGNWTSKNNVISSSLFIAPGISEWCVLCSIYVVSFLPCKKQSRIIWLTSQLLKRLQFWIPLFYTFPGLCH
jgi:hypothetical protein